jgi:hypothetical protein
VSGIYADLQYIDSGVTVVNNYSLPHPGDSQWHTLTVTVTFPATATDLYVYVNFRGNGIVYIDNAMLVAGSVPSTYSPLPIAEEWARCQRYYQTVVATARWPATGSSQNLDTPIYWQAFPTTIPTVSLAGGTATNLAASFPQIHDIDQSGARFEIASAAAGDCYAISYHVTAEANP